MPPGRTLAFLAGQPVSVLGNPDLGSLLPRLGITTLGELAALPAAEAASRLGPPGHLAHRLASGLDPRPLVPRPPAADLSAQREFDPPAAQAEPVIFAAKALAEDLHARLAASGLACIRLQVQVHTADGRQISRLWRHDGLLSGLAVAERVRWQLDGREPAVVPRPGEASTRTYRWRAGSRCCGWSPTSWSARPAASWGCGAMPWSPTGSPAPPAASRPCSGTAR